MSCQRKKMKNRTTNKEYFSIKARKLASLLGAMEKRIFDPSRGGIGTRLKIAKTRLIMTIVLTIDSNVAVTEELENLKNRPKISAIPILVAGPAPATIASPHL